MTTVNGETVANPPATSANYGTLIEKYMLLRKKKDELKTKYKEDVEKLDAFMERIEGALGQFLQTSGSQNLKTAHGTAYLATKWSATVSDGEAFRTHLLRQLANGKGWEGADIRANAPQIRKYLEENNSLPPGVNLNQVIEVQIRKA